MREHVHAHNTFGNSGKHDNLKIPNRNSLVLLKLTNSLKMKYLATGASIEPLLSTDQSLSAENDLD